MNGSCTAIHKDTIIISPNATIDLAPIDESILSRRTCRNGIFPL